MKISQFIEQNTQDLSRLDFDYLVEGVEDFDELEEMVETAINEYEVIYYYNAIKYLMENDQSLQESLEIASELGYEVDQLNSELLATLLIQQKMREEWEEVKEEVRELL